MHSQKWSERTPKSIVFGIVLGWILPQCGTFAAPIAIHVATIIFFVASVQVCPHACLFLRRIGVDVAPIFAVTVPLFIILLDACGLRALEQNLHVVVTYSVSEYDGVDKV